MRDETGWVRERQTDPMSGFVEEEDVREDKFLYEGALTVKGGRRFGFFGPVQWSQRTCAVKEVSDPPAVTRAHACSSSCGRPGTTWPA